MNSDHSCFQHFRYFRGVMQVNKNSSAISWFKLSLYGLSSINLEAPVEIREQINLFWKLNSAGRCLMQEYLVGSYFSF
jgi:hypothetical protein